MASYGDITLLYQSQKYWNQMGSCFCYIIQLRKNNLFSLVQKVFYLFYCSGSLLLISAERTWFLSQLIMLENCKITFIVQGILQ